MNKKTKTMFVMHPGGFGSGSTLFSTYEFEDNSEHGQNPDLPADYEPAKALQTIEISSWTKAFARLPEALRRMVWQPLSRRVQNPGHAA